MWANTHGLGGYLDMAPKKNLALVARLLWCYVVPSPGDSKKVIPSVTLDNARAPLKAALLLLLVACSVACHGQPTDTTPPDPNA
jgi:hypothetical protein